VKPQSAGSSAVVVQRRRGVGADEALASAMHRERRMYDLVFVVVTIGFFALGVAYTRGCDRL
jgi:hypothetical protein